MNDTTVWASVLPPGVRRARGMLALWAACLLAPAMAWAQTAQEAVREVTALFASGTQLVKVDLSAPLSSPPVGFMIQDPPRIVLDLVGVRNRSGRQLTEVQQGNLRSVMLVEAEGRTRLILNLRRPTTYEARTEGQSLVIALAPVSEADKAPSTQPLWSAASPPSSQGAEAVALTDIDFRRGEDGAGRVIVHLGSAQGAVDVRRQGRSLVVEFVGASLPEGLRRRLDVTDFGTPVRMVTATQAGDRVRLLVENTGEWEHSAYQSDGQFVLEVRPVKPDPDRLVQGPKYSGEKLSLNFQNIDVRALLQVIADFTGFNIIAAESVQGSLTLRLKDVPWDQALDIILEAKQLGMTRTGNVIRVAPKKELDEEAVARREVNNKLEALEPLRTETFRLNFAKAQEVADALRQGVDSGSGQNASTNRLLSPRGSVIADARTNQVFVTDVAARLEAVRQFMARVDTPRRQVMIQARIVEAREGFSRSLGVRLGGVDLRTIRGGDAGYSLGGTARAAVAGSYDAITSTTGQTANLMNNANTSFVNLPARSGLSGAEVPRVAISLFSAAANRFLNLELSALESDNQGRIISSPRVLTGDLTKATIKQGDQIRFIRRRQAANGQIEDAIETIDANLQLEVEPQITPSGQVLVKLKAAKNRLLRITDAGPQLDVREVQTDVMVENGGTVMIGGIFEHEESQGVDKVPVLGDVPVVGNLFKSRNRDTQKREMVIFLTPYIVDGAATPFQ